MLFSPAALQQPSKLKKLRYDTGIDVQSNLHKLSPSNASGREPRPFAHAVEKLPWFVYIVQSADLGPEQPTTSGKGLMVITRLYLKADEKVVGWFWCFQTQW